MQIVENRRGRLSRPFLGPGDNFSKSYDENQIWSERDGVRTRRAGGLKSLSRARAGGFKPLGLRGLRAAAPTGSGFRHNFSKNYPQDLKMD